MKSTVEKKAVGDESRREFVINSEAWYSDSARLPGNASEEIMVGLYAYQDGFQDGCVLEFSIKWISLGGRDVPRVELFDDAWKAFGEFRDLFDKLAELHGGNPTPSEIVGVLKECGFTDNTNRVNPHARVPASLCPTCKQPIGRASPSTSCPAIVITHRQRGEHES